MRPSLLHENNTKHRPFKPFCATHVSAYNLTLPHSSRLWRFDRTHCTYSPLLFATGDFRAFTIVSPQMAVSDRPSLSTAIFVLPAAATGTGTVTGWSSYNCQLWFRRRLVEQTQLPDRCNSFCKLDASVRHSKQLVRCVSTVAVLVGAVVQILI